MKKNWRIAILVILVFMIGIAVISSSGNGSLVGDAIIKSKLVENAKNNYTKITREVLSKQYVK